MKRILAIPMALVLATMLAATGCTPAEIQQLQGILQNVDSANGKIIVVTKDGKTITLKINTDTTATDNGTSVDVSTLAPGSSVEIESKDKGKTARSIKAQKPKEVEEEREDEESSRAEGWGIAEIRVTDPPPAGVRSAVVNYSKIEVHKAGGSEDGSDNSTSGNTTASDNSSGWITVVSTPGSFDLMTVIGVEQVLGSANLTAGKYTQIRMTVANVTGITTDNVSYTAEVPSNVLKINGNFNVGGGNTTTLTLDFDGEKSLVRTGEGKFIFKPVVKLLVRGDGNREGSDDNEDDDNSGKPDDKGNEGKGPSDNSTRGKD